MCSVTVKRLTGAIESPIREAVKDGGAVDAETIRDEIEGLVSAILVLAWSLSGITAELRTADFLVSVHVTSQERVQVTDWGYSYGRHGAWYGSRDLDVYTYDEGSLVIDVVDPTRRALIWRGTASRVVEPDWSPDEREKVVREAVQALLEHFPPDVGR